MKDYSNLRKVPLLRIIVLIVIGIIFSFFYAVQIKYLSLALTFSVLIFITSLLALKFNLFLIKYDDFLIFILFFCFSVFYTKWHLHVPEYPTTKDIYTGIICESIQVKKNNTLMVIRLHDSNQKNKFLYSPKVNLFAKIDSSDADSFNIGDVVVFSSVLIPIKNFGNPDEFDYKKYMTIKGVFYQAFVSKPYLVNLGNSKKMPIKRLGSLVQKKVTRLFQNNLFNNNSKAILTALTVGNRKLISNELKQSYTNSGVIHILAVSGLHVGIIYLFLSFLLGFMNKRAGWEKYKLAIILAGIWFYAFITGLSPSVLRSAIMFSLFGISRSAHRDVSYFNTLGLSALIMFIINPLILFDVGFQLSFLAVGGILYFQPILYNWFNCPNRLSDYFYKLLTVSISAQITTVPLTILYFHQFPSYFWLTNLLIIPLVFLLIVFAFIFILFAWAEGVSQILKHILNVLTEFTNWWVRFIESLPGSVIENIHSNVFSTILLFIGIVSITVWLKTKRKSGLTILLAAILLLLLNNLMFRIKQNSNQQFIIYNTPKESTYGLYIADNKTIYTSNKDNFYNSFAGKICCQHLIKTGIIKTVHIRQLNMLKHTVNEDYSENNYHILNFDNKTKLLIYNKSLEHDYEIIQKNIDYTVVSNNTFPPLQRLSTRKIILDSSNDFYTEKSWGRYALQHGIAITNVKKEGAFIVKM